jgi:DNA-binding NtrC family response regulator
MRQPLSLLLVDDEESIRWAVGRFLVGRGAEVFEAADGAAALELARSQVMDVALVDWSLPDTDGLTLLHQLRAIDSGLPVVVLTGHGTIELAVKAIQEGAEQFLTKPVNLEVLATLVERLASLRRERLALWSNRRREGGGPDLFGGSSPPIRRLAEQAARVAGANSPVLLIGETGSGKGVLARWIHQHGPRADFALVDLNCAGLSRELLESELFGHARGAFTGAIQAKPGLFDSAQRGTLFLDEIGDLPLELQPRLLKVLEEKTYRRLGEVEQRRADVRLIAATHVDLEAAIRDKGFRSDLYFRISAIRLEIPPLRDCGEDILHLARGFLAQVAAEFGRPTPTLSASAERALLAYPWPGNVRELRNVLERVVLMHESREVSAEVLGLRIPDVAERPVSQSAVRGVPILTLREAERQHLEAALRACGGNVERAAERLGLSRSALYARLQKHAIRP